MKSAYAGDDANDHINFDRYNEMSLASNKRNVFKDVAWVSIPLLSSEDAIVSDGDIEVKIRVSRSYDTYSMDDSACELDLLENEGNPYFLFNTTEIQSITNDPSTASNALDLIRLVPNPYYGGSNYEQDQVDNRVKITNLPNACTISIYNVSGTLVRQVILDSDFNSTGWDWDLKNDSNVSIASGVYLIHIDAGEIGEKVIKWFGALRPIDLDSF